MFGQLLASVAALVIASPFVAGTEPRDTGNVTPRPDVLIGAFQPGFIGEADEARYPLRTIDLGELDLPSGRVTVADPFMLSLRDPPLTLAFPPGRYPVDLAVADTGSGGQRVALARLKLSDGRPVRWALAVGEDQDPTMLSGDNVFGYPVDSGTGAFLDASVPAWLTERYPSTEFTAYSALADGWQTKGEAAATSLGLPHGFALIERLETGGMAMFASGWGDGYYASWVGYDDQDRPVVLVTDFAVITAVDIPSRRP